MCVYTTDRPYTVNFKCAFKYFSKIELLVHLRGNVLGCCQSAALPPLATVAETAQGFKDARHLTSYLSQQLRTNHQRQAASRSYKIIHDGLRSLQVSVVHKRPIQLIANATDSADHFSVKLSLFICMLAACSGSPPQCSTFSSTVLEEFNI